MLQILSKYTDTLFLELGTYETKGLLFKSGHKFNQRTLLTQSQIEESNIKNIKKTPFKNSMVHDYNSAAEYFNYCFSNLDKSLDSYSKFIGIDVYTSIHANISEVAISALEDVLKKQNVNNIKFFNEGISSLMGAVKDIDIGSETYLICNIGYATTDLVLVGQNKTIEDKSFYFGTQTLIESIKKYIKGVYLTDVFDNEIESLIQETDLIKRYTSKDVVEVNGKNSQVGTLITLSLNKKEIQQIINESFNYLISQVNSILKDIPGENLKQFLNNGFIISGGLTKLKNLKTFLDSKLNIKNFFASNYPFTVVEGLRVIKERKLEKYFEITDFLLY